MALESFAIGFVGAGRVACTLARAFAQAGLDVVAVNSRSPAAVASLRADVPSACATGTPQQVLDASNCVFLTVTDDAIGPICAELKWSHEHRVLHCSGATEISALLPAKQAGAATGGFHPMQMFANPSVALAGLPGCTIGVEAEGALLGELQALALRIGCTPFVLRPGVRALYHASAYYVGPFLIALLQEGVQLWKAFGATEREALNAMLPLLHGTVAAVRDGGLAKGMGGCIARGDLGTVLKHLVALDGLSVDAGQLYRALARRNVPLGIERGTLSLERAQAIKRVLEGGDSCTAYGTAQATHPAQH